MAKVREERRWMPYLAGALAGLLAIGSAYATTRLTGKTAFLGTSTTFVRASGMLARQVMPERVAKSAYYGKEKIKLDWQFMLVAGIFLGGLAGALTGRAFEWEGVPPLWARQVGPGVFRRALAGFAGGAIAMFGARLADGCPSGHGLSGLMQLSAGGLAALACFFLGGVLVARAIYWRGVHE